MSGPFGSSQWMYSSGGFYDFPLEQSLKFNDDDSSYLSWTPASAGSRTTWTLSMWVKRGNLGTSQMLFSSSTTNVHYVTFQSDDTLRWRNSTLDYETTAVFRDTSAWYHLVFKWDTTNGTAADRAEIYVNGEKITAYDVKTNAASSENSSWNNNEIHNVGRYAATGSFYFDGYLAEVNFIDGQALDASSFGEFKSGVWIPKDPSGLTYGTNGFRLSFADSANIGDDTSGNTNDWTANNLAATDVLLDSPTNNFAVWNANNEGFNIVLREGNTYARQESNGSGINQSLTGTVGVSSGKWYFEAYAVNVLSGYGQMVGIARDDYTTINTFAGSTDQTYAYEKGGGKYNGFTSSSYGASYVGADIIGVALDLDAGTLTFYKNGVSQGTAFTGISGTFTPFAATTYSSGAGNGWKINAGQDSSFAGNKPAQGNTDDNGYGDFYYAPPSGYLALCTANLPDPVIDPAQDDVPSDYFNTVTWAGTGSVQSITGVGFQPDFFWGKQRNANRGHILQDVVRGTTKVLNSHNTNAEVTSTAQVTSFDADGFTLGTDPELNAAGGSHVGWNWLAGNGTSSNTDGSITSTVSVNQKAGFSVVSFVNASSTNQETVGHGLSAAPKLIISKNRDTSANNWAVFHSSVCDTTSKFLKLNTTDAVATFSTVWGAALPTSSVFGVTGGGIAAASVNVIAYCFAEVEGYSKFGSYTGNGSTDGPFVYTGFEVAWLLVKRTDGGTNNWAIFDAARNPSNATGKELQANLSDAEYNGDVTNPNDFLSNGFKIRHTGTAMNLSGATYIYMAFAENPFKYANAR